MWHVILLELYITFASKKIALVLSWWNVGSQSFSCWFKEFLGHKKYDKILFAAAKYASVELFVLIFYVIEKV